MRTLLISYDLFRPGQSYTTLIDKLKTLGAWCRPLLSTWLVRTALTPEQARNQLMPHVDPNDKLLVIGRALHAVEPGHASAH